MSTCLYWRPEPPPSGTLPDALKYELARRIWDSDGSVGQDAVTLDEESIPYLEGLAECGIDGASELTDAVRQHGRVQVWIAQ